MHDLRQESNSTEFRELSPSASEAEEVDSSQDAGRQLDAAMTADRRWRRDLFFRLHHQLGRLRQSEKLIQHCGQGVCAVLALGSMVMAWLDASMEKAMSLMVGAFAVSFAVAVFIAMIAWVHDRGLQGIRKSGLPEEHLPAAEEAYRKEQFDNSGHDMMATILGPIVLLILGMLLLILIRVIASSVAS